MENKSMLEAPDRSDRREEDPRRFQVGNTPVEVSFLGERSLKSVLRDYFLSLKRGGAAL